MHFLQKIVLNKTKPTKINPTKTCFGIFEEILSVSRRGIQPITKFNSRKKVVIERQISLSKTEL